MNTDGFRLMFPFKFDNNNDKFSFLDSLVLMTPVSVLHSLVLNSDHHEDPEHPPIGALLQRLDVQLAEKEALVVRGVSGGRGHCRAALSRCGPGPSRRRRRHLSGVFGSRSAPRFGSVASSRPVRAGRLLGKTVGKAGHLSAGLEAQGDAASLLSVSLTV